MTSGEKRQDERFELFAQVQLSREDEVYVMSTENISAGGAFIQGDPAEHPGLKEGSEVELMLFSADDLGADFNCRAKVTRVSADRKNPGFGLQFTDLDDESKARLLDLLVSQAPF